MCRRFALTSPPETIRAHFGYDDLAEFPPRRYIRPTEPIAIVASRPFTQGRERELRLVRWGFVPGFARDLETLPLIVNARCETVLEKPGFAAAFRRRRGLVPADGFYAGANLVTARDGAPLGLAALHETYLDPNGSEIDSACILTTSANALMSAYGARMPVILPPWAFALWLDHETTSLADAAACLRPAPETWLRVAGKDTIR